MTWLEAALLGVVQGLFMFVPVSSTSHLALVQQWANARGSAMPPPDAPEMILFDIVLHVGTVVSIVVVMRRRLWLLVRGIADDVARLGELPAHRLRNLRLAGLGLVTVATTGVLGLAVRAWGTGAFSSPRLIAAALAATGGILWWTDRAGPLWRGARQFTVTMAVAVGVAQAAALLPGLSRSGLTIAMALVFGAYRRLAAEYSFFVAIPTILGAAALQAVTVARDGEVPLVLGADAYLVGFALAAVVGAGALAAVLWLLYRSRFRVFAVYVWVLAAVVLLGRHAMVYAA